MAVFEEARQDTDREVVVKLLTTLSENPERTQRDLATAMGISLGMMVSYMKSCIRKGLVRSKQVAPKRWAYFVTPKGLSEKSVMLSSYLSRSMRFFRNTREQLEHLFTHCQHKNFRTIGMIGGGDVAQVATLVSKSFEIELVLVEPKVNAPILPELIDKLKRFDAVLITDLLNPQGVFDALKGVIEEEKLLSIAVLYIVRRSIERARSLEEI